MRLLRQYTDFRRVEIIVIDNDSNDESTEYLRSLKWIKLIERKAQKAESGPLSHSRALDLALKSVKTPFVLSIHTDTFVKNIEWLDVLLTPFRSNPNLAGVGSWKLEYISPLRQFGHRFEQYWKRLLHDHFGYKNYNSERGNVNARYLRSHCAMYRTDIIKKLKTGFSDGEQTAGKIMHKKIVNAGYDMLFLDSSFLGNYIDHLNHATMILNPEIGASKKLLKTGAKQLKKKLRGIDASSILTNDKLDH
jgi:glycosyltransferase involved in cell wall biosynthesis